MMPGPGWGMGLVPSLGNPAMRWGPMQQMPYMTMVPAGHMMPPHPGGGGGQGHGGSAMIMANPATSSSAGPAATAGLATAPASPGESSSRCVQRTFTFLASLRLTVIPLLHKILVLKASNHLSGLLQRVAFVL